MPLDICNPSPRCTREGTRKHPLRLIASGIVFALAVSCSADEPPDQVPAGLAAIESTAEDAFDLALAGDVTTVRMRADELSAKWNSYRSKAESDGVPSSAISSLDATISQLTSVASGSPSPQELARAANAVSEPMPTFYEVYHPVVPSQVLALDYEGREVRLDALESDFARAGTDVDKIDSLWQGLRARVVSAGGSAEATSFEASIASERSAIDGSDGVALDTAAVDQLEIVDKVETVFAQAGDAPD
ncbi:MAG: hypothetical protein R3B13_27545 [Polyangiaceae bacterium]